jgi:hypothetical protein
MMYTDLSGLLFDKEAAAALEEAAAALEEALKTGGKTVATGSRLGPIGLGLAVGLGIGPTADGTMDGGYKQMEEACPDWDCRKASDQEVKRIVESAGEEDAHAYKRFYQAIPNKYWDICICKTGNVVLRRNGKCGMSEVTIPTWEVY